MDDQSQQNGEVIQGLPNDLATDLRRLHPTLPQIWEGGRGRNPAARVFAMRVGRYLKEGRDVPLHELQWFERYGQALVRRKKVTIEEEELFQIEDGKISNAEIGMQLLNLLIMVKKDHSDRIDKLTKDYEDRLDKHQERQENHFLEYLKLMQKDKNETVSIIQKSYEGATTASNKNMNAFVPLVQALLDNSVKLTNTTQDIQQKYSAEVIKLLENKDKPGNFELFVMMVLAPMLPVLLPAALKKMGVAVPDNFVEFIQQNISRVLTGDAKP
jgi:hypothetical protein